MPTNLPHSSIGIRRSSYQTYTLFCTAANAKKHPFKGIKLDIFNPPSQMLIDEYIRLVIEALSEAHKQITEDEKPRFLRLYLDFYLELAKTINDFYGEGIISPATNYRESSLFNVQQAKIDYYFNWDSYFVMSVCHYFNDESTSAVMTIIASAVVSPFALLNFLIRLLPIKECFEKYPNVLTIETIKSTLNTYRQIDETLTDEIQGMLLTT